MFRNTSGFPQNLEDPCLVCPKILASRCCNQAMKRGAFLVLRCCGIAVAGDPGRKSLEIPRTMLRVLMIYTDLSHKYVNMICNYVFITYAHKIKLNMLLREEPILSVLMKQISHAWSLHRLSGPYSAPANCEVVSPNQVYWLILQSLQKLVRYTW